MANVVETGRYGTYAEPLTNLRVSWGSILSGALITLAVSLILWALGLAIVSTVWSNALGDYRGVLMALWLIGIVTTWIGAFFGGMIAGYLPGNPRRVISALHAVMAWALAFLVASAVDFGIISGVLRTGTNAAVQTASAAAQTAGASVGGQVPLAVKAYDLLLSLGYSPQQARAMVGNAQKNVQQALQGKAQAGQQARGALNTMVDWLAGLSWSWFGTWIVALALAVAGGGAIHGRVARDAERRARAPSGAPLHPTPTPA